MTDLIEVPAAGNPPPPEASGPGKGDRETSPMAPWLLLGSMVFLWFFVGRAAVVMVLALGFMIFMHELGHYLTARAAGMKVTEFFLGFGPRIWSFHKGETEYGLKAIPLGAYVRIIGMNNLDTVGQTAETQTQTYTSKSYARRMSVVLAGSAMHFLMALITLLVLHAGIGWYAIGEDRPELPADEWKIVQVVEGSAAEAMGLMVDDRILSIEGFDKPTFEQMAGMIVDMPNRPVSFEVLRDGESLTVNGTVGFREAEDPDTGIVSARGFLGVGPTLDVPPTRDNLGKALVSTGTDFGQAVVGSVMGIVEIPKWLVSQVSDAVPTAAEPITLEELEVGERTRSAEENPLSLFGIVRFSDQIVEEVGWTGFIFFFAMINIFIGLFNLIPLLPFDGGHAAIATYERLRSRPGREPYRADVAKLLPLTYMTLAFLGVLTVFVLWSDITRDSLF